MALPKLLREIFENDGAGPKFRADKIPVTQVTVDSALSSTSKNPVQNKVINSALDGKLSTSGGTVRGDTIINYVSFPLAGMISTTTTRTELLLNYNQGGWLTLLGKDFHRSDKGGFLISANAGHGDYVLAGLPNGSLTWCGRNVLTGNSAGLTVVAESYSANSWYRKYSDGWIEQGGKITGSSGVTLTFPLAFSNTNYSFVCNTQGNSTGYGYKRSAWISSRTATTVTLGSDAGDPAVWFACGK